MTPATEPRSVGLKGWLFLLCVGGTFVTVFWLTLADCLTSLQPGDTIGALLSPLSLLVAAGAGIFAAASVAMFFTQD